MKNKLKVKILVEPTYLEDHSDPSENSYYGHTPLKLKITVQIQ